MASEHEEGTATRIIILRIAIIAIFILYTVRLFGMQVVNGDLHRSRAQNIARRTTVIPAQRGEIFDRHFNQPLVTNINSYSVRVIPAEIPRNRMPEIIDRLSVILGINREQIERRLPPSIHFLYQPVEIASNVSFNTIAVLAEQRTSLPGVSWHSRPLRNYLETGSISHIIGYVGSITREEFTMLFNLGYQLGDIIGKSGIERQYDLLLRGREGRETKTVDARGRIVAGENRRIPPEMGRNLVLTIDRDIQILAENALGRRIGSVVVMRPTTGEILAMVSYPWYDPNIFTQGDLGAEYLALFNDPNRPFLNRAIQASYPPASSFKIPMNVAILAANSIPPEQTIDCRGEINIGDRLLRCHVRRPGHGRLNLRGALAQSCNIYYAIVGRDFLGIDNMVRFTRDLGFGELSGIDLPGEIPGFVPSPQWKERRLNERWHGGDTMNMAIGQGFTLVTPLQMANMVAMIVNDGVMFTPHVLKEVRDPLTGAVEKRVTPTVRHRSEILDPAIFAHVRSDMRAVITEGTARFPLNLPVVQIAGKTGTGEVAGIHNSWHSWFVAYAPYNASCPEEKVVVSVIVEAVNEWEWWAPFCSAIIFQGIFANQTYEEAMRTLRFHNRRPLRTPETAP